MWFQLEMNETVCLFWSNEYLIHGQFRGIIFFLTTADAQFSSPGSTTESAQAIGTNNKRQILYANI